MFSAKVLRFVLFCAVLASTVRAQLELCKSFVQQCNRDEFLVGRKRMVIFHQEKNWEDAKAHCESIGMHLLATTTKKEVDDLKTYLNSRIWDSRTDAYFWNLWLAANDFEENNVFKWTATGQNLTYTTWAKDEPNGGSRENCLELKLIYYDETWWNDAICTDRKRYICEMPEGGLNK